MSPSFPSETAQYGAKNPILMWPESNIQEHSLYSALLKTLLQMRTLMITAPGISWTLKNRWLKCTKEITS